MRFMNWFVRAAGLYNASAVIVFLTPGALDAFGVAPPYSDFWVWLPALMGLFAGIVLLLSAMDLQQYGAFPFWNGIIRFSFVIATFTLGFGDSAGTFITLLAAGDLVLVAGTLIGLPLVLGRTPWQLLTNRPATPRPVPA
ncbi:hypothetical protein Ais01nite_37020 [Asanoa ishikariensis]|uniref:Uncharacterized protein n=1 Tax=Asanoa ishikariensis TaxID=137265 RepID=A0A1H3LSL4_9ACTN|nr:hypothetical protein [Asanoa ishikariensis]GIF65667.1 hypothetical protein Ais01nite_37020 [Asanoa ishikariensis]SDY67310.1 hypothetical protein SAMN05421684_0941 [Asanoa ishikariensis]